MNLFVLKTWLQAKFTNDERGANLVEYILLVALIALAVIAAVVFLRGQVSSKFNETGSKLSTNDSSILSIYRRKREFTKSEWMRTTEA